MLFRTFRWSPGKAPHEEGGPLFVPRLAQGDGRHDNPGVYGTLYFSRSPESAVAEFLKDLGRHQVGSDDLLMEDSGRALAAIDERGLAATLLDLDDPRNLMDRELRPSVVATSKRNRTQRWALDLYREKIAGFEWWSTIEASWINVTLFADRALEGLRIAEEPRFLTLDHPAVQSAARAVGVRLAA